MKVPKSDDKKIEALDARREKHFLPVHLTPNASCLAAFPFTLPSYNLLVYFPSD